MLGKCQHGVLIALFAIAAVFLYYLGDFLSLGAARLSHEFLAGQPYHELCLLLLTGPVIYAANVFRVSGGIIVSLSLALAILPHAFLFSPYPDPVFRLVTFAMISILLAGFMGSQKNSKERLEKEHARLERFLSETIEAREREKRHLAHELHDESLQALVDISHSIDELLEAEGGARVKSGLRQLQDDVNAVLEGTRRFVQGLRPPLLEEMGLEPSLRWLAEQLVEEQHIEVSIDIQEEEMSLSETGELTIYRITQEALNNVRKHSQATKFELSLAFAEGKVRLRVADNGVGFSMPSQDELARERKFGLIGILERARLAGGSARVQSAVSEGTVATVEIPLLKAG